MGEASNVLVGALNFVKLLFYHAVDATPETYLL